MQFIPLKVQGAFEIVPAPFADDRGYFVTLFDRKLFSERGLQVKWLRENQSGNNRKGILRGFHFQRPPFAETKLVRCVVGAVFDVLVDLRRNSPTYGTWDGVTITADRFNQVYIPRGCAHAYCTVSDRSVVAYMVDGVYAPQAEEGIRWNDPRLNVPWPLEGEPILSEKDRKWLTLDEFESPFS